MFGMSQQIIDIYVTFIFHQFDYDWQNVLVFEKGLNYGNSNYIWLL